MPSSNPTMPASSMSMTFFISTQTALYSTSWTPSTTGQYAGTCIFLIVLGAIFQILLAARVIRQQRWRKAESKRRLIVVDNSGKKTDITNKSMPLTGSLSGGDFVLTSIDYKGRPWRLSTDIARAALDTITLGVGYLL